MSHLSPDTTPSSVSDQEVSAVQPFWSHLDELRRALIRIAAVLVVALVALFAAMPHLFDQVILAPTEGHFLLYRWVGALAGPDSPLADPHFSVELINIRLASQFLTHLSSSFWLALLLCFPYLIYEVWRFIRPALYRHERRSVRLALWSSTGLFYLGCAVGYLVVFPLTFRFLATYTLSPSIENTLSLDSYMGNFLGLIFVMGLAFELPILCRLLSATGIVTRNGLRRYRRHMVVALLLAAAFITPSGDPFTLAVVFTPLYLLYEAGICIAHR